MAYFQKAAETVVRSFNARYQARELTIFPLILPRRYQIPTQCKMLIFHWKGLKGFGPPLTLAFSFSAAVRRSSHTVAPRPLPSPTGADKFKPPWTLWAA